MRVTREQAAENRSRIVDVAGRLFREKGLDGIGVADLMKAAGLTHGGFYGHFDSKDALAAEACARALARSEEKWNRWAAEHPETPLAFLFERYLSEAHRAAPGQGCAFPALAADAARRPDPALKRVFAEGMEALVGIITRLLPASFPERAEAARRRRALAIFAQLVGAIVLARAVGEQALADEILQAVREDLAQR